MEREQFFILEKDFLAGRQVGDLIQSCGIEGLGAYMVILLYLRHQPRYRGCYTLSLLQQLARCNNGTVEMFGNVILNFGLFSLDEGEEPEFYSPYLDRVMEPLERKRANSRRNGLKGGRPAKKVRPVRTADETCVRHGAETVVQERLQLAVNEEEKPRKTYNTIQNNTKQKQQKRVRTGQQPLSLPLPLPLPLTRKMVSFRFVPTPVGRLWWTKCRPIASGWRWWGCIPDWANCL
ncbi:hypothetical protein PDN68_013665 [Bacteroides hominis]|uniref:hypothetical protein n=1 Tax=Bacteroides TaxID=816 RepID=UPI00202ECFFA|nr:hypothetical protein [Bacteroides fragilis]MDA1489530.1 hypothetical protein [Bacteroides fragilis]